MEATRRLRLPLLVAVFTAVALCSALGFTAWGQDPPPVEAAPPDTAVVQAWATAISAFLVGLDLGLPPEVVDFVAKLVAGLAASIPFIPGIWLAGIAGTLLLNVAPRLRVWILPWWLKIKWLAVPILAALVSQGIFGNPLMGFMAAGVRAALQKRTNAGTAKARMAVLLVALMLPAALAPSPAAAAEGKEYSRWSLAIGAGYRYERQGNGERIVPYVPARGSRVINDWLKLELGANIDLARENPERGASAAVLFVF